VHCVRQAVKNQTIILNNPVFHVTLGNCVVHSWLSGMQNGM